MFRYTFGGDTFLYVEVSEEGMSLEAFFQAMAICDKLRERNIKGITEICPANASYMVAFDPDILHYNKVLEICKELEKEIKDFCNSKLAEYKWIRSIEFVEEMPKTISGKIRKTEQRAKAAGKS